MTKLRFIYKYLIWLICLALCVAPLSACRKNYDEDEKDMPILKIGCAVYEPYFFIDENGDHAGIDVELAREACRRMGYKAEFVVVDWSEKDDLLRDGAIDCAWSCFSMNDRYDDYDWAGPYASDRQVVAVLASSDIYTFEDLRDASVAVSITSLPASILLSKDDERIPPLKHVYCLEDIMECVSAMKREYVDACAGHEAAVINELDRSSVEYRILEEPLAITQIGVAFYRGKNADMRRDLHITLKKMDFDGYIKSVFESYGLHESEVSENAYS